MNNLKLGKNRKDVNCGDWINFQRIRMKMLPGDKKELLLIYR